MTREKQLNAAIKLLSSSTKDSAELRERIEDALNTMEVAAASDIRYLNSKKAKKSLDAAIAALKRARVACKALPPLIQQVTFGPLNFDKYIAAAEKWRERPANKGGPAAVLQREAVKAAYEFCPKPVAMTRSGKWHQLSAIFFGKKSADLYRHMREFNRSRAPQKARQPAQGRRQR